MKQVIRFTLLATALLLALLACQNTLSGIGDGWDPNLGRLVVRVDNGVQATSTIAPDLAMVIDQYTIILTGPNAEEITATLSGDATSRSFFNLAPGEWTVTGAGWEENGDSPGVQIAEGSATVLIEAGERATATLVLTVLEGDGTLDLTILWPEGFYAAPEIDATLTSREEGAVGIDLDFSIVGDSATYRNESLPAGYYDLSIALLDDNQDIAWSRVFAVRIVADQESIGEFNLRESETTGVLELTVQADLNNPYEVSFVDFQSSLGPTEPMTVGVSLNPDPGAHSVEVQWFLNGQLAGTGDSIDINADDPNLNPGTYWLDALVTVGTTLSSNGLSFTVQ